MQFINTFIALVFLLPLFNNNNSNATTLPEKEAVTLEIINKSNAPFQFSMQYESRRDIIKFKSEKPIESLRVVDSKKNHKSYDVRGSDLIMIPASDLKTGIHYAELKFQKSDAIIISKITIGGELL